MKTLIVKCVALIFLFTLSSCSEDSGQNTMNKVEREMIVNIDGEVYELKENTPPFGFLEGNTNCNSIFINTYIQPYGNNSYARLGFDFDKKGQLKKATLLENQEGSGPYAHFFSADLDPKKYLNISDFEFNPLTGNINFSFEGKLFRHERGTSDTLRIVAGNISMASLMDIECSYQPHKRCIEYQSDEFEFFSINANVSRNTQTQNYEYKYRSNLGFRLEILNENDLWNYPEGSTFQFDNDSQTNSVSLYDYTGHPMTNRNTGLSETYWKKYETIGSYEIIEKVEEFSVSRLIGEINMDVYDNGELLFSIQDMTFSTEAFE